MEISTSSLKKVTFGYFNWVFPPSELRSDGQKRDESIRRVLIGISFLVSGFLAEPETRKLKAGY